MDAPEKITLVIALAVAVVYLWRAYQGARDETIKTLQAENESLRKMLSERDSKHAEN